MNINSKMKTLEKNYLKAMLAVFIAILIAAVFSLVYAFVDIAINGTILNNILELVYMGVHIIAAVLAITLVIKAIKSPKGSHIMKTLMINDDGTRINKVARVVAIILSVFGLAIGIYFLLVICGVPLPYFHFPITLILDLINSPFSVFIVALFFIFYPYIYFNCYNNKEEQE